MRLSGKISAAIEILADFNARRVPLKTAIADWSRHNRYAGAKDRAWISGLCLDVLRKRNSLAASMGEETPRALAFGALRFLWATPVDELSEAAAEEPHGPGALTETELKTFQRSEFPSPPRGEGGPKGRMRGKEAHKDTEEYLPPHPELLRNSDLSPMGRGGGNLPPHIVGDFPEWLTPHIVRVFGEDAGAAMAQLAERADVDLRVNTLKATPEKALAALKSVKGAAVPILTTAARIAAPDPSQKAPAVTVIPAFNKGWVEVQDLSSQIAAAAAGAVQGLQVLDYCAGGGGKTLALAAMMENTGQLYAYDRDPRRLKPLFHRAKRAGVRNLQIRSPAGDETFDDLADKMDVVFVDAPCSGAGAWRRHPDTKWRLTEKQLATRINEQDAVLREAARFVKPGGRMIWVTCSFLMEENEDRLAAFLDQHEDFARTPVLDAVATSGLLTDEGRAVLAPCVTDDGALRLTPDKLRGDGFFVAVLQRSR